MPRVLATSFVSRLVLAATVATFSAGIYAQDKKGPAFTEPPKNDPNFNLQGEFVGRLTIEGEEQEPLGLQIRPTGGNHFEAVSFMGGLPGEENHKPEPVKMIGRRSGDFVILSGGPWAIFVEADKCLVVDREGNKVGQLERIKRKSPTMHAPAPEGAVVLFDGSNIDHFTKASMTKDGLLMQGADLKPMFQDFDLHVEFRLPYMPQAVGQSRGNSGLYLQSRYECQILDSFGQDRLINGLGALYKLRKPDVNMCFPPLVWQTYDVRFTAPRWAADGSKLRDAHITSWINGVKVQDNVALPSKTGAGSPEEPTLRPSRLQDHGDPVRFRNIWLVDRGMTPGVEFPVIPTEEQLAEMAAAKEKVAQEKKAEAKRKAAEKEKAQKAAEAKKKAEAEAKAAEKKPEPETPTKPASEPKAEEKPAEDQPAADEATEN